MSEICFDAFILDTIEIGSKEHRIVKECQNIHQPYLPKIIGFRSEVEQKMEGSPKNIESVPKISIISTVKLQPLIIKKLDNIPMSKKFQIILNYIECLQLLHKIDYFPGLVKDEILFYCTNNNKFQIKFYKFQSIKDFQPPKDNEKKDVSRAQHGIFGKYQNSQKIIQALNIWRWGKFTAKLLYAFNPQDYLNKLISGKQLTEQQPVFNKLLDFPLQSIFNQILKKSMSSLIEKRPKYEDIKSVLRDIKTILSSRPNKLLLETLKLVHNKQKQKLAAQFNIEFGDDIILTEQLKKKLASQFVKLGLKQPKGYKPLFRASKFNFNHDMFYQYCNSKSHLLFVIDIQEHLQFSDSKICVYLAPALIIKDGFGIFGHYISDTKLESFIYSSKNQEVYKILSKDKAFRVCPGYGPIIGDGDLILNNREGNQCLFPRSYQTGKHKKLPVGQIFKMRNYDVYQVTIGK